MPHTARVLRAPERDLSYRDFTTLLKAGKVADLALGEQTITGHDEREQTLNQLLAEMDGFDTTIGLGRAWRPLAPTPPSIQVRTMAVRRGAML
jgi:hypothetical protein